MNKLEDKLQKVLEILGPKEEVGFFCEMCGREADEDTLYCDKCGDHIGGEWLVISADGYDVWPLDDYIAMRIAPTH